MKTTGDKWNRMENISTLSHQKLDPATSTPNKLHEEVARTLTKMNLKHISKKSMQEMIIF